MDTAVVMDEFECQLKCMGNNSCKSCNVHPGGNSANRICELNNKTRQMKPGDFKWKKGSTYYGSVQVSSRTRFFIVERIFCSCPFLSSLFVQLFMLTGNIPVHASHTFKKIVFITLFLLKKTMKIIVSDPCFSKIFQVVRPDLDGRATLNFMQGTLFSGILQ